MGSKCSAPSDSYADIIRTHYEPRLSQYREGHRILDWEHREAQLARFEVLVHEVDLSGRSIVDVGCGLGELYAFLQRKEISCRYTGIDILPGMIKRAAERHPEARFLVGDALKKNPFGEERFDVVFCSGIFNLCIGDNYAYLAKALNTFYAMAEYRIVFNLLSCDSPDKSDQYFYFVPERVLALLDRMNVGVTIVDGYLPNDFTVVCSVNRVVESS